MEGWKRGVGVAQGGKEDSEEVSQDGSWGGKGSSDDIFEGDYDVVLCCTIAAKTSLLNQSVLC